MQKINIEDLYTLVVENKISKKEGAKIIWQEIYKNPHYYGLEDFTEDQKSEFLLELIGRFERIFDDYIPDKVPFRYFIKGCIQNYKLSWVRKNSKKEASSKSIDFMARDSFENDIHKYEIKSDFNVNVSENEAKEKLASTENETDEPERYRKVSEMAALVLAMKVCKEIDSDVIEKVAAFSKVPESYIYEKIQELKNITEKKDDRRDIQIKKRNNAFFYHRKYLVELHGLQKDSAAYENLKERYNYQTKNWKKQNETLKRRFTNSPSNAEIAKALGLKPRQVSFYISHVKRKENADKIKTFLKDENENLDAALKVAEEDPSSPKNENDS